MNETIGKMASRARVALIAGTAVVAGSSLAFSKMANGGAEKEVRAVEVVVDETPIERTSGFVTSFAPVVKKVAPSVVKVFTTTKAEAPSMRQMPHGQDQPFLDEDLLRRFFGDRFRFSPGQGLPWGQGHPERHGLGSGVIVSEEGYILTNNHVVENADKIKVALHPDGREYEATVVGTDPKTDLAVLKIEAKDLPAAVLGSSEQTEIGDLVLAVGNPFGIGQTVTMGMVSATGRANVGLDYEDFIQTDAAINPGNSGGALVDAEGRLIGINTAILSRSGGNNGIGFAVPIDMAREVMNDLIRDGRVVRGFLGVNIQDLTQELAEQFGAEKASGALVSSVTRDSAAEEAGVKAGDVVVEFNGHPIKDSRGLKLRVGSTSPGEKVDLVVLRDGKEKRLKVTLKELPGQTLADRGEEKAPAVEDAPALKGVVVADVSKRAREQFQVPKEIEGALVTQVDRGSEAYQAGLRQGDVIQEINRQKVAGAEDAVSLVKNLENQAILLRVWSKGGSRYLIVQEQDAG